jgi:Rrf2 family protein
MSKSSSSLQLNRSADYAIRAMIYIAGVSESERTTLPELARATDAPESFLSKILQELCRAALVTSSRGHLGGFTILPAGRNATIGSVVAAVDGPIHLNACLVPCESCQRKDACPAHPVWASAQVALLKVLDAHTIDELARDAASYSSQRIDHYEL